MYRLQRRMKEWAWTCERAQQIKLLISKSKWLARFYKAREAGGGEGKLRGWRGLGKGVRLRGAKRSTL